MGRVVYATDRCDQLDDPWRDGEILEVHGEDGDPPFLVRWSDNGHESIVFPGAGTQVVSAQDHAK